MLVVNHKNIINKYLNLTFLLLSFVLVLAEKGFCAKVTNGGKSVNMWPF